jgi:hypothetical protein
MAFYSSTFLRLLEHFVFLYRNRKNVSYSRDVMRKFFYPNLSITPRHPWRGKFIVFYFLMNKEE